jgi:glycosyltransferase involved in cell wall biosynthesis
MITTFYPPYSFGGDGMFVRALSSELAMRGHHVEVVHCLDAYRFLARQEPTRVLDDHPNVIVHGLKSPFGFLSALATHQTGLPLFKSARLRQILDRGFDVIHYHNISLVGGPKVLEYGRGLKLYTMHEYWLGCPTHVLFKFNREACTHRQCVLCSLTYKRPPQWWRYTGLLESALKHVDVFISPSRFGKDIHRTMGLDIPIVRLANFVSPAGTTSASASGDQELDAPYFLFVGRLEKLKGVQTIIPVFRHYRKAKLLIAGQGRLESQLRELAAGSPNIRFLGYQSDCRLSALYRGAVAVIMPSLCYESLPLVLLEAFREGTPVIVRNLGGMPEVVEESGGGFVFTTEEELAAAMDQLLADPSRRQTLGARGYQAYRQNWTPEVHVERYLALIREVAEASTKLDPQRADLIERRLSELTPIK